MAMCQTIERARSEAPLSSSRLEGSFKPANLSAVDSVDVTIIVDNTSDILLPSQGPVKRPSLTWDWSTKQQLIAEHGYSLLLSVRRGDEISSLLYDAGLSANTASRNLDVLGLQPKILGAIVLSHGHVDHHGGLEGLLRKHGQKKLPLILHPDAWRERKVVFPSGAEIRMPPPNRRTLEENDVQVVEERGPSMLFQDSLLVTGQVERVTDFETGFPLQYSKQNGGWQKDPWIWDDQGVVCSVKGKGLVVASSCSHSGVINVLRNAKNKTGVEKIYGFIGGMHLTGGLFEGIISRTVDELVTIRPDIIVPGHCTGWKATHQIAARMPEAYIQTSVGTQIHFG